MKHKPTIGCQSSNAGHWQQISFYTASPWIWEHSQGWVPIFLMHNAEQQLTSSTASLGVAHTVWPSCHRNSRVLRNGWGCLNSHLCTQQKTASNTDENYHDNQHATSGYCIHIANRVSSLSGKFSIYAFIIKIKFFCICVRLEVNYNDCWQVKFMMYVPNLPQHCTTGWDEGGGLDVTWSTWRMLDTSPFHWWGGWQ